MADGSAGRDAAPPERGYPARPQTAPGAGDFNIQCPMFNIQFPSGRSHFSRQAAKPQRGFLEGRPPCRPGNPDIQNTTMQGLTPLQIRFEPQRAQRTQRTFGRVRRTLSGLSARGGVSRAVGAENFMIQCSISNIQFSRKQPESFLTSRRPPSPRLRWASQDAKGNPGRDASPGFSTNDQRRTTNDHCPQLFSISIPHATDDGGMTP